MSDDEYVHMYPVRCDGGCKRQLGWSDAQRTRDVILCNHCMNNPDEIAARHKETP